MAENIVDTEDHVRTLRDYGLPMVARVHSAIRKPAIVATNFEIMSGTIHMVQSS